MDLNGDYKLTSLVNGCERSLCSLVAIKGWKSRAKRLSGNIIGQAMIIRVWLLLEKTWLSQLEHDNHWNSEFENIWLSMSSNWYPRQAWHDGDVPIYKPQYPQAEASKMVVGQRHVCSRSWPLKYCELLMIISQNQVWYSQLMQYVYTILHNYIYAYTFHVQTFGEQLRLPFILLPLRTGHRMAYGQIGMKINPWWTLPSVKGSGEETSELILENESMVNSSFTKGLGSPVYSLEKWDTSKSDFWALELACATRSHIQHGRHQKISYNCNTLHWTKVVVEIQVFH